MRTSLFYAQGIEKFLPLCRGLAAEVWEREDSTQSTLPLPFPDTRILQNISLHSKPAE